MKNELQEVIRKISEEHAQDIGEESGFLLEVDLAHEAEKLGLDVARDKHRGASVWIPVKKPGPGMKVMFDGRGFSRHVQFESGVIAPEHVAREAKLPFRAFQAPDSMVRIIA